MGADIAKPFEKVNTTTGRLTKQQLDILNDLEKVNELADAIRRDVKLAQRVKSLLARYLERSDIDDTIRDKVMFIAHRFGIAEDDPIPAAASKLNVPAVSMAPKNVSNEQDFLDRTGDFLGETWDSIGGLFEDDTPKQTPIASPVSTSPSYDGTSTWIERQWDELFGDDTPKQAPTASPVSTSPSYDGTSTWIERQWDGIFGGSDTWVSTSTASSSKYTTTTVRTKVWSEPHQLLPLPTETVTPMTPDEVGRLGIDGLTVEEVDRIQKLGFSFTKSENDNNVIFHIPQDRVTTIKNDTNTRPYLQNTIPLNTRIIESITFPTLRSIRIGGAGGILMVVKFKSSIPDAPESTWTYTIQNKLS